MVCRLACLLNAPPQGPALIPAYDAIPLSAAPASAPSASAATLLTAEPLRRTGTTSDAYGSRPRFPFWGLNHRGKDGTPWSDADRAREAHHPGMKREATETTIQWASNACLENCSPSEAPVGRVSAWARARRGSPGQLVGHQGRVLETENQPYMQLAKPLAIAPAPPRGPGPPSALSASARPGRFGVPVRGLGPWEGSPGQRRDAAGDRTRVRIGGAGAPVGLPAVSALARFGVASASANSIVYIKDSISRGGPNRCTPRWISERRPWDKG